MRGLFNFLFGQSGGNPERTSRPVIRREEDDLPLEIRFKMRPGRIYRKFPFDSEAPFQTFCAECGGPIFGETQGNCLYCSSLIYPRMVDVTDEPNHLPKQADPDLPQVINADALLPTFGGDTVEIGRESEAVSTIGDQVLIRYRSEVERVAGNSVRLEGSCSVIVAVAKEKLEAGGMFQSEEGVAAKEVIVGWSSTIKGAIIIPEKGLLVGGEQCTFETIYVGAGAEIKLGDGVNIGNLVILGPGVKITLGKKCHIGEIESDDRFNLQTGREYTNDDQYGLQHDYDLFGMVNELVDQALAL